MKIQFLGTGSAFCLKNYQTNLMVIEGDNRMCIDVGGDIRFALRDVGLSYKDIQAIYITHLHTDHCGGMEYFAFGSYFDPTIKERISLIGNNEVIRELWTTLKGGLRSIQTKRMTLDEYFDVEMIKKNRSFEWSGINFQIVQAIHIVDEFSVVPSYGLIMTTPEGKKIYYTSDTQFAPNQISDFYKMSDVIIQDCETTPFKSGVHAHFNDLCTLPAEHKAKMWLVHYSDNVLDNGLLPNITKEWSEKAIGNGFKGFAAKGSILEC